MVYSPNPPFEILSNRLLSHEQISQLRRLARYWDLIGNSGNFVDTLTLVIAEDASPFDRFLHLCEWLHAADNRVHGISLVRLMEMVFRYATQEGDAEPVQVAGALWNDYLRAGRRDIPHFLREFDLGHPPGRSAKGGIPPRQRRHLADR